MKFVHDDNKCSCTKTDKKCSKREETTRKIMAAASKIFADVGFEGARVDEIAKAAGVNKATLYYNIGDKEALYTKVIDDVIGASADNLIKQITAMDDPEQKLILFIQAFVGTIFQEPYLANILMREHAGGGKNFPDIVGKDFQKIVKTLKSILEEGEKKGVFRKVHPLILHMHIIGGISFFKTTYPVRKRYNIFEGEDNLSLEEALEKITDLLMRSVKK